MRDKILQIMIERAVPFLNRFRKKPYWPYSQEQMRNLPTGTLGNDVANFLDAQNLSLLPKYEVHDTLHVLLNYGTTPKEELKLQGFMIGNKSVTFGGKVLFGISLIVKPEYLKEIRQEIKRGKKAESIQGINFIEVLDMETSQIRSRNKL
ncbi:MAG: ubiquinone biosynthesis protein Coq4 [Crocinitomix sp.]|jgi:ubiquinone biosynthesis protein Coq4